MGDGGTIGAATPVQAGQPGGPARPVEEKTVSYVRKEFRATAEARKRPPLVAEAMVDADVEIPGLIQKGKLLTLTTDEALKHKVADFRADTIEGVLKQLGLAGGELGTRSPTGQRILSAFSPIPLSVLFSSPSACLGSSWKCARPVLVFLEFSEFRVSRFSSGGTGWSSSPAGRRCCWWVQGLVLLAVEIFVTPGFGLAGVLGIAALLSGLSLSLIGGGATWDFILKAVGRVIFSLLLAVVGSLVLLRFLPRLPFGKRLILETGLAAGEGYASSPETDERWLGKGGTVVSPLRPCRVCRCRRRTSGCCLRWGIH